MSTAVAVPTSAGSQIPLSRLVTVELRKMVDTRAGRWLLLVISGLTVLVMVGGLVWAEAQELTFREAVQSLSTPQGFLLPVLGVLSVTSEWSQRTGLVTFTLEPRRGRIILAKIAAAVVMAIVATLLVLTVAAIGNAIAGATGGDGSWSYGLGDLGEFTLLQIVGVLAGTGFGMLFLNSAAAITLYYIMPLIWSVLTGIIGALDGVGRWLDLNRTSEPLWDNTVAGVEWARFGTSVALWLGVPLAIGAWRIIHAEIKSS